MIGYQSEREGSEADPYRQLKGYPDTEDHTRPVWLGDSLVLEEADDSVVLRGERGRQAVLGANLPCDGLGAGGLERLRRNCR